VLGDGDHPRRADTRREIVGDLANVRDADLVVDERDPDSQRHPDEREDDQELDEAEAVAMAHVLFLTTRQPM